MFLIVQINFKTLLPIYIWTLHGQILDGKHYCVFHTCSCAMYAMTKFIYVIYSEKYYSLNNCLLYIKWRVFILNDSCAVFIAKCHYCRNDSNTSVNLNLHTDKISTFNWKQIALQYFLYFSIRTALHYLASY